MGWRMDRLPPLNALRAFEAAGRHQSIRRAAAELSVTAGSVSRQVQALEASLGVPLFRRRARGIVLTSEGERYLTAVIEHLDGIREATEKLTGRRPKDVVRILAYTTVAMKWLIPRLGSFHAENKGTEVRLTTSNEAVDFARENIDGAIRLGDGKWPGLEVDRLMANELVPLCTPAFQQAHGLHAPADLSRVVLLHSFVRPDDWRYWLEAANAGEIDPFGGDKYASSALVYQAVLGGLGIMMAHKAFFLDDLRDGRLVQPFGPTLDRKAFTYYLIYSRNRLRSPAFRRFRTWLLAEARREEPPGGGAAQLPG